MLDAFQIVSSLTCVVSDRANTTTSPRRSRTERSFVPWIAKGWCNRVWSLKGEAPRLMVYYICTYLGMCQEMMQITDYLPLKIDAQGPRKSVYNYRKSRTRTPKRRGSGSNVYDFKSTFRKQCSTIRRLFPLEKARTSFLDSVFRNLG